MLDWFRGRGNAETGPRDGEAPVLEQLAVMESEAGLPAAAFIPPPVAASPFEMRRDIVLLSLSQKVLGVHLANRFQTAYPLVLNFQTIGPEKSMLLAEVAAAALQADPRNGAQADALRSRLVEANAEPGLFEAFEEALARPRALSRILPDILDAGLGPHAYAVSLIALGRAKATGRHHLAYLASRLGLGEEIVGSLKRRYQT